MAGIGFSLRKLHHQDNLLSTVSAYGHSAIVLAGPWLLTVLTIGIIIIFGDRFTSDSELLTFRLVIIYNFIFSLVFTSPILMLVTRHIADSVYQKNLQSIIGTLLGALIFASLVQLPIVIWFYFGYAHIESEVALYAVINYLLISTIWFGMIFANAIKDYKTITCAFLIGFAVALLLALQWTAPYGEIGMLNAFNIGLGIIIVLICARVFTTYPYRFEAPFAFLKNIQRYWPLVLGALLYNAGIWVDKWIMWFSPYAIKTSTNFYLFPDYDSAMFLAYLTVIPSMAMFLLAVETRYFEHHQRFYDDIKRGAAYDIIQQGHRTLKNCIYAVSHDLLIFQATISLVIALTAPQIFSFLGLHYLQINIFRMGVLGVLFQIFTLYITVLLSYFDARKIVLTIFALFFVSNIACTLLLLPLGYAYYGFGYFIANVITFLVAVAAMLHYTNDLPFHTFVTRNKSA